MDSPDTGADKCAGKKIIEKRNKSNKGLSGIVPIRGGCSSYELHPPRNFSLKKGKRWLTTTIFPP